MLAFGCKPTITCEDVPCPFGQFCSDEGTCVFKIEQCEDDTDCEETEVCDLENKICSVAQLPCTDTFACPISQNCNTLTGFCEPESICSRDGCSVGQTCNPTTEVCTATRCLEGRSDCPIRFTCSPRLGSGSEGVCEKGCLGEGDCPQEEFCLIVQNNEKGRCIPSCVQDRDCPFGSRCVRSNSSSICEKENPCINDAECRSDEICSSQRCTQPPCFSNIDCEPYQFCERSTGTCSDLDCDDDIYGNNPNLPNFSFDNAAQLEEGDYRNLRLCPGSQDWFKVRFRSTDIVQLGLNVQSGTGLGIRVYDDLGGLIAEDARLEKTRILEFAPSKSGDFYFEFLSASGQTLIYDFEIQTRFCRNDIYEENDSIESAKNIPALINAPITLPLHGCPDDVDWFAFRNLEANKGLSLVFSETNLNIIASLITPDRKEIALPTDRPFRALKLGLGGDYFVKISLANQSSGSFNLTIESKVEWECPDAGENTTALDALDSNALIGSHHLCPNDLGFESDWLRLPDNLSGLVEIEVQTAASYNMDVLLWSGDASNPVLHRRSISLEDGRRILQFQADSVQSYYLRVSSDEVADSLFTLPLYSIRLVQE